MYVPDDKERVLSASEDCLEEANYAAKSTQRTSPSLPPEPVLWKGLLLPGSLCASADGFYYPVRTGMGDGVPCGYHSIFKSSDTTESWNPLQLAFPTCVSTLYSSSGFCPGGEVVAYFRDRIFSFPIPEG